MFTYKQLQVWTFKNISYELDGHTFTISITIKESWTVLHYSLTYDEIV